MEPQEPNELGAKMATGILVTAMILLLFSLFNTRADAAETWLTATVASYHHNRERGYNERNFGLGLERKLEENWSAIGGWYRNSYDNTSIYAGTAWMPIHRGYFHFGIAGGAVTGYSHVIGAFAFPTVAVQGKQVGMNIAIVPSLNRPFSVIGLQLKVNLR